MPDLNVTSPGQGFARQARMERRVELALNAALRRFLTDLGDLALSQGQALGAASAAAVWAMHTSPGALEDDGLPPEVAAYVSESIAPSTLPDDAYTGVMAVLAAGATEQWSAVEVRTALADSLAIDGREAFLTAAAPSPRTRDAERRKAERDRKAAVAARSATARANAPAPEPEPARRGRRRNGADWGSLDEGGMTWAARMKRDARTAVTGLDGIISTAEMARQGIPHKMWVTRRDERVRHTHNAADGQVVPLDQPFLVGGYGMMHPGDRNAPASETINCRCITVGTDRPIAGTLALPFLPPS